jgi:hypothetical protein
MDSYLKGEFNKEEAKQFLDALKDIQKLKVQQVLFNIDKDDSDIKLYVVNDNNTILSHIKINKEVLNNFEIETSFIFGVYDLHELINLLSVFDGGFKLEMNRSVCEISNSTGKVKYYAAESDLIREGKKTLSAKIDWFTEFTLSKEQQGNFVKAVPIISGKFVIIEGKAGQDKVALHVKDKDISSSNSFSINIEVDEIFKDFKMVLDKDNFMNIIAGSCDEFNVQVGNVALSFYGETDGHTIKSYVGPRTD